MFNFGSLFIKKLQQDLPEEKVYGKRGPWLLDVQWHMSIGRLVELSMGKLVSYN